MFVSLAVPGVLLGLILARDNGNGTPPPVPGVTTTIAPIAPGRAEAGTLAPDFTLKSTSGATVTLSARRGRPQVIVFFASWCNPCEEELPVLEQFARENAGRLGVVGVSFRDLGSDSIAFVRRLGITFPALLDDPSAPVARRYGVRGIPQTIFVDARGIVRGRLYGATSRHDLQPSIDDLLHGAVGR